MTALVVASVSAVPAVADQSAKIPIAVSYFANTAKRADLVALEKGLADMLITDLSVADDLVVVEREHLDKVIGEIRLQKNPFFDRKSAQRLGKGVGADFLLTGSYLASGKSLRIDLRVVDVATGEVVFATSKSGADGAIFELEGELAAVVLKELGARLSLIQKKRLGRGGPRMLSSLSAYSRALAARDRGDRADEKKWLNKALTTDPGFSRIKQRLATLEAKVDVLAKSGGLILSPTSATDFLHNHRLLKERGDYRKAKDSLTGAIRANPRLVEGWFAAYADPKSRSIPRGARLPTAMSAVVRDYLAGNAAGLRRALSGKTKVHAAAFLFDLAEGRMPSKLMAPYLDARDAIVVLERESPLDLYSADPRELARRIREVKSRYLQGKRSNRVTLTSDVEGTDKLALGNWQLEVSIDEKPTGTVQLTLRRSTHRSWRERPKLPPYPKTYRIDPSSRSIAQKLFAESDKAHTTNGGFLWGVPHPVWGGQWLVERQAGRQGKAMKIPASAFNCSASDTSLTGRRCSTTVEWWPRFLLPGEYRFTTDYQDPDGHKHRQAQQVWLRDLHFHESYGLGDEESGDRRTKHYYRRFKHAGDKQLAPLKKSIRTSLVGPRKFKVDGAIYINTYWKLDPYDPPNPGADTLQTVYFDIDFAENGGVRPSTPSELEAYRNALVKRGYKVKGDRVGRQFLPLPTLSDDRHTVCAVVKLTNGAVSPKAHCTTVDPSQPDLRFVTQ